MYSLNAPTPGEVSALAPDLARDLPEARARPRDEQTLVLKRLGRGDRAAFHRLSARAREALAGAPAVEARVTGVDCFADAATGPSPVVYLAVESPGLRAVHERLCEAFDPIEGLEGEAYVPHVTVARGGGPEQAAAVCREIDPVEWTVNELQVYDAERDQRVSRLSLPA
ncbi:phosphoesterase [Halobacteriales archaeon SW_10_68_16]|nr:MAG: phosphoesterase [Halobacteriales archaeon SW_10_68_16]